MQLQAQAILFDMDGTLIDSSQSVLLAWQAWCRASGADLAKVLEISHGTPCRQTIAQVTPHLDLASEVAHYEALERSFDGGQHAIAGAAALLAKLPLTRWALVTSASEANARLRFSRCHLPFPPVAITSESVHHGKPSPEPFLLAAERLGVTPADCLVFEDSPAGIQAGLAAGCQVVAVGELAAQQPGIVARIQDYDAVECEYSNGIYLRLPQRQALIA